MTSFVLYAIGALCLVLWLFEVGSPVAVAIFGLVGGFSTWLAFDNPFDRDGW